jgi:hypothetical protein
MTDSKKIDWQEIALNIFQKYGGVEHFDFFQVHCPCPEHTDDTPSCSVRALDNKILVHCQVCDGDGSHKAYSALVQAGDIPTARVPQYLKIWNDSNNDTIFFETYFEARGLSDLQMPSSIRVHDNLYHCDTKKEHTAIVTAIHDVHENMIAIHRTYLNDNQNGKLDSANAKMMLGNCRGGHVTLRKGSRTLHIGEGLETTFAVLHNLHGIETHSVWATLSAANFGSVNIPYSDYAEVHLWADLDQSGAGEKHTRLLAQRLYSQKIAVYIHLPKFSLGDKKSIDWLDVQGSIADDYDSCDAYAPTPWEADNAIFPAGFEISMDRGVVMCSDGKDGEPKYARISDYPIWVRSRCPKVGSQDSWIEVGYWSATHRRVLSINVPRATFTSLRDFQSLLLKTTGVSVDLRQQPFLCDYLRRCSDLTNRVRPLSDRHGWIEVDDDLEFIPFSKTAALVDVSGAYSSMSAAFTAKGSVAGWIEGVLEPVTRCYGASFVLGASLAAPILYLTNTLPFSTCLTATRDGGKSISISAALSIWGQASKMAIGADSSRIGIERGLDFFHDLPFLLEESQLKKVDDILKLLYSVGNSTMTLKGTKDGGLREDSSCRGVLFLPGESKLAEKLSYDGAQVRLLVLDEKPLAELELDSERTALCKAITTNYGIVGPLLIQEIQKSRNSGELMEIFTRYENSLEITADFQRRQRSRYAAMLTGIELFGRVVGVEFVSKLTNAVMQHWNESAKTKSQTLVGFRALRAVLDYKTSHPNEFCISNSLNTPQITGEIQDDGGLALIRGRLRHIFQDAFDVTNVIEEWRNLNWLRLTDSERRKNATRTRARIGLDPRAWAVVLSSEAIENYYDDDIIEEV